MFQKIWAITLSLLIFSCASTAPQKSMLEATNTLEAQTKPYILLISLDGFRNDYLDLYNPPFLKTMQKTGGRSKSLIPIYPSITFPNHYSIVTGLYAEHSGILANHFYHPQDKSMFALRDRKQVQNGKWYHGLPLWLAVQDGGMLSATYFWPGSDANIQERYPNYYRPYDEKIPNRERVEQILSWLKLPPENRPHLLTLYFSDVDTAGHNFGPKSPETEQAVLNVDSELKYLADEIHKLNLPVNIVVVSDHGMEEVNPNKLIYLEDYLSPESQGVIVTSGGAHTLIYIPESDDGTLRKRVQKELKKGEKFFKVYPKGSVPKYYHYDHHPASADFVLETKFPYYLFLNRALAAKPPKGAHGYDPAMKTMQGIFMGKGPNILDYKEVGPIENIHIYPFLLEILKVPVSWPIDGSKKALAPLLKP